MKTSKSGYKKTSKDRNEPILRIPSNQITMKDVPHPVLAILDDGTQHLMYPDQNYNFNTNSVIEIPMKQNGGQIDFKGFEKYVGGLPEDRQTELLDYIDSLSQEDQYKFMAGGKVMWKKYQKGGRTTTQATQKDFQNIDRPLLKRGSRGDEVVTLQAFLQNKGYYTGDVDGIYGPKTERAVRKYQKWFNENSEYSLKYKDGENYNLIGGTKGKKIMEDGVVGNQTRSALMYRQMPKTEHKEVVEVEPPALTIDRQYSTTDNNANAGPVGMNYGVAAGLAGMAAAPWLAELLPAASGDGAVNTILNNSRQFINQAVKGKPTLNPRIPGGANNIPRSFSPKTPSSYGTRISFQEGGNIQDLVPVEVEGEETVQTPNGNLYEFKGRSHAQGGIDVMLEAGSKVFSEHLKAPKEVVKAVLGKETKKKYSFADLSKKFDTTKWSEILDDPNETDKYKLETAKLMMSGNHAMLNTIFAAQEGLKNKSGGKKMQDGGDVERTKDAMYIKEPVPFTWEGWGMRQIGNNPRNREVNIRAIRNSESNQLGPFVQPQEDKALRSETYADPTKDAMFITDPQTGDITWEGWGMGQIGNRPKQPFVDYNYGETRYRPVVTDTGPSTLGISPSRITSEVPYGGFDIVDPNDTSVAPDRPKPKASPKKKSAPAPRKGIAPFNPLSGQPITSRSVTSNNQSVPDISGYANPVNTDSTTISETDTDTGRKFKFGISPKLAGTVWDIGMALSDKLNVVNPQYRDLRKTPLFTRFVDFENKTAAKNLSLAIQQVQNSNLPESAKQARISNLTAQYQEQQSQSDLARNQVYQNKLNADTAKLQQYMDTNIDQHFQDIERYNQQKARVEFLKDQFKAQRKSRVVNAVRGYLDYIDEVTIKNQLLSDNYRVNPLTGQIDFTGEKRDPFNEIERKLNQYAQNASNSRMLPNGAQLAMLNENKGLVIDADGKTQYIDLSK